MKVSLVVVTLVCALATVRMADAYPQFQLSRDQTCTGCHLSPAGGSVLNENGLAVAESISQFGTAPEFFYNKVPTPGWLVLGGDLRGAAGFFKWGGPDDSSLYAFPMQIELTAHAKFGPIALHITGGLRPPTETNEVATALWAREHYVMWQQKPGENTGLYVRAGHFMPVFGLRFAEHPMYTRRFGGTQLDSETYGVAVEFVDPTFEVHGTGFIEDYTIDPVEHAAGFAGYGEYRLSETLSFGGELMFKDFTNGKGFKSDSKEFRVGVTNKLYLKGPELLLQTEIQFINQVVGKVTRSTDSAVGGAPKGIVGNLVASRMLTDYLLLDLGLGHFDSNFRIANLDRDCVDLNVHWFTTSHVEFVLNGRFEMVGFNKGADPAGYGMLQLHYRL